MSKQGIELVEPRLPRLAAIRGQAFAAPALLFELMQRGLYLGPQPRDALPAGLTLKLFSACFSASLAFSHHEHQASTPALLSELMQQELYLDPQSRDALPAGLTWDAAVAGAMCEEVALASCINTRSTFTVICNRYNCYSCLQRRR